MSDLQNQVMEELKTDEAVTTEAVADETKISPIKAEANKILESKESIVARSRLTVNPDVVVAKKRGRKAKTAEEKAASAAEPPMVAATEPTPKLDADGNQMLDADGNVIMEEPVVTETQPAVRVKAVRFGPPEGGVAGKKLYPSGVTMRDGNGRRPGSLAAQMLDLIIKDPGITHEQWVNLGGQTARLYKDIGLGRVVLDEPEEVAEGPSQAKVWPEVVEVKKHIIPLVERNAIKAQKKAEKDANVSAETSDENQTEMDVGEADVSDEAQKHVAPPVEAQQTATV